MAKSKKPVAQKIKQFGPAVAKPIARSLSTPDQELADALADFWDDPLGYVMFAFPWDDDPDLQVVKLPEKYHARFGDRYGPDAWACEFLDRWGAEIKKRGFNGKISVPPIQFSTASGHGIGKTALVAWIVKFIMDTRPGSRGTVTANTADQLKSKTWAEVGKWHYRSLTKHWFIYSAARGAMRLYASPKIFGETAPSEWYCQAQTCREENSEAFAGQHAPTATSFYVFDEASGIPDRIFEVREGGTTDGEPMTFDFGNPTRNSGKFHDNTVGKMRGNYIVRQIDSRNVQITNKERIAQWVKDYGEDSDFVKVRVRGIFPSQGSLQFIPSEWVDNAMLRPLINDRYAPLVIGVDCARRGEDETVIYPRIGMDARSFAPTTQNGRYRGLEAPDIVAKVQETIKQFRELGMECRGLFVDATGVGGPVCDFMRRVGMSPIEVNFGGGPVDKVRYRYKSDEVWGNMKEAIRTRLILPPIETQTGTVLRDQLTMREFGYLLAGNRMHLESKEDMKERLKGDFSSPDIADALACTFSFEVPNNFLPAGQQTQGNFAQHEYDPYSREALDR